MFIDKQHGVGRPGYGYCDRRTGRIEDAQWDLENVRSGGVDLSLERIEQVIPFRDPTRRSHLIDGLYKAGL